MAANIFAKALPRVLAYEGGKSDNPKDPGGRTNEGVIQRSFTAWLAADGHPSRDVYTMTDAERDAIYKELYWDACRCDELPAGVDFAVFDAAVNSGPVQAGKWLQQALGADYIGPLDGRIGPGTVVAAGKAADPARLVAGVCARRLATLKTLRTYSTFGKGWSARIANVCKIGQAWADAHDAPAPVAAHELGGNAKARPEDVKKPLVPVHVAAIGTGAGSAATTATSLAAAANPLIAYLPKVAIGVAGLTVVSAVLTIIANATKDAGISAQAGASEVPAVDLDADSTVTPVPIVDTPPPASPDLTQKAA